MPLHLSLLWKYHSRRPCLWRHYTRPSLACDVTTSMHRHEKCYISTKPGSLSVSLSVNTWTLMTYGCEILHRIASGLACTFNCTIIVHTDNQITSMYGHIKLINKCLDVMAKTRREKTIILCYGNLSKRAVCTGLEHRKCPMLQFYLLYQAMQWYLHMYVAMYM